MIFSLKALDAHMVWVTTIVGTVAIWEGDRAWKNLQGEQEGLAALTFTNYSPYHKLGIC